MSPPKMGTIFCKDIYWRADLGIFTKTKLVPFFEPCQISLTCLTWRLLCPGGGERGDRGQWVTRLMQIPDRIVPDKYCQQEITFVRLSLALPADSSQQMDRVRAAAGRRRHQEMCKSSASFHFALLSVFEYLFVSPLSVINPDGIARDANGS